MLGSNPFDLDLDLQLIGERSIGLQLSQSVLVFETNIFHSNYFSIFSEHFENLLRYTPKPFEHSRGTFKLVLYSTVYLMNELWSPLSLGR